MSKLDDEIGSLTSELAGLCLEYEYNYRVGEEVTALRSHIDKLNVELTRLQFIRLL